MAAKGALPTRGGTTGWVNLQMHGDSRQVEAMLDHLDTAINPIALGRMLGLKIDPYIRQRARARFTDEGDSASGKWHPLSMATQAARASQGYGPAHPINKRTGELEAYVIQTPHDIYIDPLVGATLITPGVPPSGQELTKKVKTAQQGDGRTPARPVMAIDQTDMAFTLSALVEHVTSGLL